MDLSLWCAFAPDDISIHRQLGARGVIARPLKSCGKTQIEIELVTTETVRVSLNYRNRSGSDLAVPVPLNQRALRWLTFVSKTQGLLSERQCESMAKAVAPLPVL